MEKIAIALTGHRPNKLPGKYDLRHPHNIAIGSAIREHLLTHLEKGTHIHAISGMALGADTIYALVALKLKKQGYPVTLECAIPCANHPSQWPKASRDQWQSIVDQADRVTYVSRESYRPALMQKRNEYMVDHCDELIAIFDGTSGGTANCVNYAQEQNKTIFTIHPNTLTSGLNRVTMVSGDLLASDCDVIFHQANCFSTMGAGIAKQIAQRFPIAAKADRECELSPQDRLGKFTAGIELRNGTKIIVNLYGQYQYGRGQQQTDYQALEKAFLSFLEAEEERIFPRMLKDQKYGVPYKMGCGLAGGDWNMVLAILNRVASKYDLQFHVYKKEA